MTADPNLFRSIDFTQALEREERQQLLRNTNSSRASAEEQDAMFSEWPAGCLRCEMCRVQETRENDRTRALDLIGIM
jgi:hypothetical protein